MSRISSRRVFLSSTFGSLAAAAVPWQREPAPVVRSSFDPWIEVRPDHLQHNVNEVFRRTSGRAILAVIKNNGYGLGLLNVARILEPFPAIGGFAVVKLEEAVLLRRNGIRKMVLLMGPFSDDELDAAVAMDITPMVYTPIGDVLETIARKRRRSVSVHVCVDTGIGRVGVPYREALALFGNLAGREGVKVEGMMMTFVEEKDFDEEQFKRFRIVQAQLQGAGINPGMKHAVSSYGLFQHPDKILDAARPGMVLFGIFPEPGFRTLGVLDLRPALSLKSRVVYAKKLFPGDSAGYNRVFTTDVGTWVATLSAGHADGLPRECTKGGRVRIGSRLYKIIAISASHTIVELGPDTIVKVGDVATFFDWSDGSRPEDFAASYGGSVYDLTMHLNPLLPRTVM